MEPIFGRCYVHVSLELIFDLGVAHGVVCFFSLMSIISSFAHFVVVGVVSFSSFVLSFPFLDMLGSWFPFLIINYIVCQHQLIHLLAIGKCK